jgi:hypothetical protein
MFTPTIHVSEHSTRARDFSIALSSGFCVVESDWGDTKKEAIDYHVMHVSLADHPKNVPMIEELLGKDGKGQLVYRRGMPSCSSVHVGGAYATSTHLAEVVKIEVLEYQKRGIEDHVRYDHSILVTFDNARQFIFSPPQSMSILGGLEFTGDAATIEALIPKLTIRCTLE